jgi:hypothetical protein
MTVNPRLLLLQRAHRKAGHRVRNNHHEDTQQALLFRWLRVTRHNGKPLARRAWHTPNGGKRDAREAGRLKVLGVKPGVPDVTLAIAAGGYHGLFIELKWGDNDTTDLQDEVIADLREEGYRCEVAWSWMDAAKIINDYLGTSYSF